MKLIHLAKHCGVDVLVPNFHAQFSATGMLMIATISYPNLKEMTKIPVMKLIFNYIRDETYLLLAVALIVHSVKLNVHNEQLHFSITNKI